MTKESLENRLKELDILMQQTLANYQALDGAKQECMNWIKKLEEEVPC